MRLLCPPPSPFLALSANFLPTLSSSAPFPPPPLQVLGPLGTADLLWVAALPAVSEELLFRGALIPAVYPDW